MTLRCKAGDLALVTHDELPCRANIGKLVKVAGPIEVNRRGQKTWLIEPVRRELWWTISAKGVPYQRDVKFTSNVEHPDDWLLPIDQDLRDQDEVVIENYLRGLQEQPQGVRA